MPFDVKFACEFMETFCFERIGGTPTEDKAARLITDAIKQAGAACQLETFPIHTFTMGTAGLEITVLYKKRYPVKEEAFSSDNIPFSWHDIPSIGITGGADYNLFGHTTNDAFQWCGSEGLEPSGEIALEIIRRLGNARIFPFQRGFNETASKSLK